MHHTEIMTNGDYNPFLRPERLPNDRRQMRVTILGLALSSIVLIALIIAALLATRACEV
jgi:hypothetical protein